VKFLVTGGAGFIGSHIVEKLLKDGHDVVVLDNFFSGKEANLSFTKDYTLNATRYTLIKGDIRDKSTSAAACFGIDYVLHQAALRSVPKSMKDPESYNDVNIGGTLNMLQAAAKAKVKRFVFASSSSVYGDVAEFPQKETFYPKLISPYALSKLAGEYYCRIFSEHFGLETICLRYFNVFGPRQALDDEYAVVIPKFIHSILHDAQPPIFGNGRQSRDFTYIDNVVEANFLSATTKRLFPSELNGTLSQETVSESTAPKNIHEFFNVANGHDHTVLELVEMINKIIGKNIEPKFLPLRAGDVFRTCADISEIKTKLGFIGKVNFAEGLKNTVDYWKELA